MDLPIENQRLRELINRESYGVQQKFADEIGVTLTHINRFFRVDTRSGKVPSILKSTSVMRAIEKRFPGITRDWFVSGEVQKTDEVSEDDLFALEVINRHKALMKNSTIYRGHIQGLVNKGVIKATLSKESFNDFLKSQE